MSGHSVPDRLAAWMRPRMLPEVANVVTAERHDIDAMAITAYMTDGAPVRLTVDRIVLRVERTPDALKRRLHAAVSEVQAYRMDLWRTVDRDVALARANAA